MERDERDEIEDVVHASLGRQLRVTSLLGLLFLVVGFILGHYVAAQHTRELSVSWSKQTEELQHQIEQLRTDLKEEFQQELAEVRESSQQSVQAALQAKPQVQELVSETRRLARATEDLRQSLITRCIEQTEKERARILQELQPYLDRKLAVKASDVSTAVSRLVDQQIQQLRSIAQGELSPQSGESAALAIKSEISPVSGESSPPQPAPGSPSLLPVPGEAAAPDIRESATLAPLPAEVTKRSPIVAEPTTAANEAKQFFKTPRKPQLFIPARKTAAVPEQPAIR